MEIYIISDVGGRYIPDTESLAHGVSPVHWLLVLLVWSDDTVVVVYHQLWGRGGGTGIAFISH